MVTKKNQKPKKKFHCIICDFKCNNKRDYERHEGTRKHKNNKNDNKKTPENPKKIKEDEKYKCINCGKFYRYKSGLSRHKIRCNGIVNNTDIIINKKTTTEDDVTSEMLKQLVTQNQTLQKQLIELSNKQTTVNYNNCHNKKMTINVFLNEECKNAMNLTDFVNGVQVSLNDIMYTKEHGYAEGISNIFVKHLQNMPPTERPIHCSDSKRLHFYIKDENKWEKDDSHVKIDKSIQDLTMKQMATVKKWEEEHPNYLHDDKLLQEWHSMIQEIMGKCDEIQKEKNELLIKKSLSNNTEIKEAMIMDE
jgi:hypothetical protein|uniref:C2H2-type domain-containing protein n=1 Tax=viral metagenome TaxID=1070528 RepID=A0A6C0AJW8_9ZZZZ